MICSLIVESCGSVLSLEALTATISTTSVSHFWGQTTMKFTAIATFCHDPRVRHRLNPGLNIFSASFAADRIVASAKYWQVEHPNRIGEEKTKLIDGPLHDSENPPFHSNGFSLLGREGARPELHQIECQYFGNTDISAIPTLVRGGEFAMKKYFLLSRLFQC